MPKYHHLLKRNLLTRVDNLIEISFFAQLNSYSSQALESKEFQVLKKLFVKPAQFKNRASNNNLNIQTKIWNLKVSKSRKQIMMEIHYDHTQDRDVIIGKC